MLLGQCICHSQCIFQSDLKHHIVFFLVSLWPLIHLPVCFVNSASLLDSLHSKQKLWTLKIRSWGSSTALSQMSQDETRVNKKLTVALQLKHDKGLKWWGVKKDTHREKGFGKVLCMLSMQLHWEQPGLQDTAACYDFTQCRLTDGGATSYCDNESTRINSWKGRPYVSPRHS